MVVITFNYGRKSENIHIESVLVARLLNWEQAKTPLARHTLP